MRRSAKKISVPVRSLSKASAVLPSRRSFPSLVDSTERVAAQPFSSSAVSTRVRVEASSVSAIVVTPRVRASLVLRLVVKRPLTRLPRLSAAPARH